MTFDNLDFMHDGSGFPVSIEELAAYLDGNLAEDERRRVASVIEKDDTMQDIMDGMEQAEEELAACAPEDMQLPGELAGADFDLPDLDRHGAYRGNRFGPFLAAACFAVPTGLFEEAFDPCEAPGGRVSAPIDAAGPTTAGDLPADEAEDAGSLPSEDDEQPLNDPQDEMLK